MNPKDVLEQVRDGDISVEDALLRFQGGAVKNLGFACLDLERARRCGTSEIIFCEGKTPAQVSQIMTAFREENLNVIGSRASREMFEVVAKDHPEAVYYEAARMIILDLTEFPKQTGKIAVVCAGTSDLPVAEEACLVAERMGANIERLYDVGVAGLHRLLNRIDVIKSARVVIVVAGMEGALPSVVGGLVDKPIVAVPTSVGYGVNFQGLTALMAMMNSCVPGITVVNVDNGLGAGVAAALINRVGDEI